MVPNQNKIPLFYKNNGLNKGPKKIEEKAIPKKLPRHILLALKTEKSKLKLIMGFLMFAILICITWIILINVYAKNVYKGLFIPISLILFLLIKGTFSLHDWVKVNLYQKQLKKKNEFQGFNFEIEDEDFLGKMYLKNSIGNVNQLWFSIVSFIWIAFITLLFLWLSNQKIGSLDFKTLIENGFFKIKYFWIFGIILEVLIILLLTIMSLRKRIVIYLESENINALVSIEKKDIILNKIQRRWMLGFIMSLIVPLIIYLISLIFSRRKSRYVLKRR